MKIVRKQHPTIIGLLCVRARECMYFCWNCWLDECRDACHIHSNVYPSEISAHIKLKGQQLCATVRAVERAIMVA